MEKTITDTQAVLQTIEKAFAKFMELAQGPGKDLANDIVAKGFMDKALNALLYVLLVITTLIVGKVIIRFVKNATDLSPEDLAITRILVGIFGGFFIFLFSLCAYCNIQDALLIKYHPQAWFAEKVVEKVVK